MALQDRWGWEGNDENYDKNPKNNQPASSLVGIGPVPGGHSSRGREPSIGEHSIGEHW
jgi:hypothetical protein